MESDRVRGCQNPGIEGPASVVSTVLRALFLHQCSDIRQNHGPVNSRSFSKRLQVLVLPCPGFSSVAFCLFTLHLKHCCVLSSSKCEKPSLKVTRKKKELEMGVALLKVEMVTSTADIIERLIKNLFIVIPHRHGTIPTSIYVTCLWLVR